MASTGDLDPDGRRPFDAFVTITWPVLRRAVAAAVGPHLLGHLDVDDLVQTAYERLWQCYDSFDNEVAAYAYGQRVALSRAANARRDAGIRSGPWLGGVHRLQPAEAPAADDSALARIQDVQVRAAVTRLPRNQRRAVALVHLAELQPAEAAEVMGTTPTTIKGLVQRGRKRLRHDLADNAPGLALLLPRFRRPSLATVALCPGLALFALSLTVLDTPHPAEARPPAAEAAVQARPSTTSRPWRPGVLTVAPSPARPEAPPPKSHPAPPAPAPEPTPLLPGGGGACIGDTCAGEQFGDRICVYTGQEDYDRACANQGFVGVCPLFPPTEHATCERDTEPMVDPPPHP